MFTNEQQSYLEGTGFQSVGEDFAIKTIEADVGDTCVTSLGFHGVQLVETTVFDEYGDKSVEVFIWDDAADWRVHQV